MLFKKNKPVVSRPGRRVVQRKTLHARAATSRDELDDYEGESEPSMKLSQAFIVVLVLHVLAVGGIYGFNKIKENTAPPKSAKAEAAKSAVVQKTTASELPDQQKTKSLPPATAEQTYTVVAGDTLRRIASKFNTSIEAIEKANNLSSNSILKVGQVLVVGKGAKSSTAAAATTIASAPAKTQASAAPTPAVVAKAPPVKPPEAKTAVAPSSGAAAAATENTTYVVAKGDNPYLIAKKHNITQAALMKANNIDDPRKLQIGQKLIIP